MHCQGSLKSSFNPDCTGTAGLALLNAGVQGISMEVVASAATKSCKNTFFFCAELVKFLISFFCFQLASLKVFFSFSFQVYLGFYLSVGIILFPHQWSCGQSWSLVSPGG